MKTLIIISGQVAGNHRLHQHLHRDAERVERSYQDFRVTFRTKAQAKHALWQAYKNLRELEPDFHREGGITYLPGRKLIYDASTAYIAPRD